MAPWASQWQEGEGEPGGSWGSSEQLAGPLAHAETILKCTFLPCHPSSGMKRRNVSTHSKYPTPHLNLVTRNVVL